MKNRWTSVVLAVLVNFTCVSQVHAQTSVGNNLVTLGGKYVRWHQPKTEPVTITYTFARAVTEFSNGISAQNCQKTQPLTELLERSELELAAFHQELLQAMQSWEAVTNVRFVYTDREGEATLRIAAQTKPKGIAWANLVVVPPDTQSYRSLQKAIICLNPSLPWTRSFSASREQPSLLSVLRHEIGHVLGLNHGPSGALMSFRYVGQTDLTPSDIRAVQFLYGKKRQ